MTQSIQVMINDDRYHHLWNLPQYATDGSAGMDLRAAIDQPITIQPNQCTLIETGIAMYIANHSLTAMILPRSGLGHKHGLVLGNLVGLIDADYQGSLKVSLWNRSQETYTIKPGDRVAQLVIVPVVRVKWQIVEQFEQTSRADGGFGHTGVNKHVNRTS